MLSESLECKLLLPVNYEVILDNLLYKWSNIKYGQLSATLVMLRYLYNIHQTNHWTVAGGNYYGDHLLFQRLYEDVGDEIDKIAERSIGLGSSSNVELQCQLKCLSTLAQNLQPNIDVTSNYESCILSSMQAEYIFLKLIELVVNDLKLNDEFTLGLEDLLPALFSKHEEHIYLLKQRLG
jgi:DNA-binding ferritin-like protein